MTAAAGARFCEGRRGGRVRQRRSGRGRRGAAPQRAPPQPQHHFRRSGLGFGGRRRASASAVRGPGRRPEPAVLDRAGASALGPRPLGSSVHGVRGALHRGQAEAPLPQLRKGGFGRIFFFFLN